MDRARRIAYFEARVGHASAVTRTKIVYLHVYFFFLVLLTMTLVFAYVVFHSRWLWYAWWLSLIPLYVAVLYRMVLRHRCKREASEYLGVRLGPFLDVPMSEGQYPIWCEKHGVATG